jgi:undecaprenyl-diphosphatase
MITAVKFVEMRFFMSKKWTTTNMLEFLNKHKSFLLAVILPAIVFVQLMEDLIEDELSVFDDTIYMYIRRLISEDMTEWMKIITMAGSWLILMLITFICLFVFWKNKRYFFFSCMIALNLVVTSALNDAIKLIFHRERPDILRLVTAGGFSFPSGHSMNSISFYGYIAYLIYVNMKSRWKYAIISLLSITVLLIGISRIYLGVHYASDVLAGFAAGLAWLAIFIVSTNKLYSIYKNRTALQDE